MKMFIKCMALYFIGGVTYFATECLFRGRSHWTMTLVGGLFFINSIRLRKPTSFRWWEEQPTSYP